jgi:hypothetical protein
LRELPRSQSHAILEHSKALARVGRDVDDTDFLAGRDALATSVFGNLVGKPDFARR